MAGSTQSPWDAPAVIVHGIREAAAALRAADPALGLVLLSAPGAGVYAGAGWFVALCRQAAAARPGVPVRPMLDCADAAGAVLAALRVGVPAVVFTGDAAIAERLSVLAAAQGAQLLDSAPTALDLAGLRTDDAWWQCRLAAWLAARPG